MVSPSPLEAWGVSYVDRFFTGAKIFAVFPAPREAWGVSYARDVLKLYGLYAVVSVPSRGLGGFLRENQALMQTF